MIYLYFYGNEFHLEMFSIYLALFFFDQKAQLFCTHVNSLNISINTDKLKSLKLPTLQCRCSKSDFSKSDFPKISHRGNSASVKRNYNKLPKDSIVAFHKLQQKESIKEHC